MSELNVLMFHELSDQSLDHSAVSSVIFESCLDLIIEIGMPTAPLGGWASRSVPGLAGCITFDDGSLSDYVIAFPALLHRKLSATFFLITGRISTSGYMSWEQIRTMAQAGMEFGSHSHSHPFLSKLSSADVEKELSRSKSELELRLGQEVLSLSLPNGDYDERVLRIAEDVGYSYICLSRPGLNPLPLSSRIPIRRNAFHRLIRKTDFNGILRPNLLRQALSCASYESRVALRSLIGPQRYVQLRARLFGRANKA